MTKISLLLIPALFAIGCSTASVGTANRKTASASSVVSFDCRQDANHAVTVIIAADLNLEFAEINQAPGEKTVLGGGTRSEDSNPTALVWYYGSNKNPLIDAFGKPLVSNAVDSFQVTFADTDHTQITKVQAVYQNVVQHNYSTCTNSGDTHMEAR
jgi:hypothetical protein